MAISFPRELPDVGFASCVPLLDDGVTGSRTRGRLINITQHSAPIWRFQLTTLPLSFSAAEAVDAWWLSLRGGLRKVLFKNPHVKYPKKHWDNPVPATDAGSISTISNGNQLTVESVSPALSLSVGDFIGLERSSKYYLGRVTEASGSGTSREITVEPPPYAAVRQVGAVVRFERPALLMRPIAASYSVSPSGRFKVVSFALEECD